MGCSTRIAILGKTHGHWLTGAVERVCGSAQAGLYKTDRDRARGRLPENVGYMTRALLLL